ncbi:MAG TPA: multicopper oxidase family protein [Aestuariivirga sp.]|nr:multicopper oxidase family protein [Aestuariivirga sp.]
MNKRLSRRAVFQGIFFAPLGASLARAQTPADLTVASRIIEVNGRAAKVFGIVNGGGGNGLSLMLGERFRVRVKNNLDVETLLHWHGLNPPSAQDGVPMLSQAPLTPGESFDYEFVNTRSGSHWMHSHVGLQEQQLLAAPLIVRETAEPLFDEQEHVVMLHDFTFRDPLEILAELKAGGGEHAGHAMAGMLNDIMFDAYLANDRTLADPEVVSVGKATQIRLRIINGSAASNMWIDLGQLQGELIAVDGNAVYPLKGALFPLAIAQRADIRVKLPEGSGAWPILFRPEGTKARTGIYLATRGAEIAKLAGEGDVAPEVDLAQEMKLRSIAVLPPEPVTRTEILTLTGGGADYRWGLNGKSSMHETIFTVREGERIEIIMQNQTGMAHPMHLHGHYFKVAAVNNVSIEGALRDTVLVPPSTSVTIRFAADNPGNWAFHCHHLYHMNAGMMGAISYSNAA